MRVRTISKNQLALSALLIACNGRVKVGAELRTSGSGGAEAGAANDGGFATGGTSMGGHDSEGGEPNGGISATPEDGGSPATPAGGASSVTDAGAAGVAEGPTSPQWLAVVTSVSEGRSTLSVLDLAEPDSE